MGVANDVAGLKVPGVSIGPMKVQKDRPDRTTGIVKAKVGKIWSMAAPPSGAKSRIYRGE